MTDNGPKERGCRRERRWLLCGGDKGQAGAMLPMENGKALSSGERGGGQRGRSTCVSAEGLGASVLSCAPLWERDAGECSGECKAMTPFGFC